MKGGEFLQFRHFLISGLMVGAALFLPENAFAEKNEVSGQLNPQKALVQSDAVEKVEAVQTKIQEEAEKEKSLKARAKQPPSSPKLEPSPKAALVLENLPEQAKPKVQSAIENTEKVIKSHGHKKEAAVKESAKEIGKNKPTLQTGKSALPTLHNRGMEMKNKAQSERLAHEPIDKALYVSISQHVSSSEPIFPEPKKEGKVPVSKEEIPKTDQVLNQTQRTNSSGGQSNDRASFGGFNTISFLDKWFEWNKFYEIELIQPYLSRHAFMNNQWVNAPPSPPPQTAPLLKMVNRC